jgi:hypothetical protein
MRSTRNARRCDRCSRAAITITVHTKVRRAGAFRDIESICFVADCCCFFMEAKRERGCCEQKERAASKKNQPNGDQNELASKTPCSLTPSPILNSRCSGVVVAAGCYHPDVPVWWW